MFNNVYSGQNVLITGNTGFKGSWLSLWLKQLGANVYGYSDEVPTVPALYDVTGFDPDKMTFGDICDLTKLTDCIVNTKPKFLFHLAAQPIVSTAMKSPLESFQTNTMGMATILEVLRVQKLDITAVMITSDKCYENINTYYGYKETDQLGGKDPYSASKGAAEIIFRSYFDSYLKHNNSLKIATCRAGNVIGGGDWAVDRIIVDCFNNWARDTPASIRKPNATRPWQHVLEPLSGYLAMGQMLEENPKLNGESFNFGPNSNQDKSVLELITQVKKTVRLKNTDVIVSRDDQFNEANLLKLNCDKAIALLNWRSVLEFDECCEFVGQWYSSYFEKIEDMKAFSYAQIDKYTDMAADRGLSWTK